ncbi:MAG: metal-dependent hydrolase [Kiritimatiellia bacterium]
MKGFTHFVAGLAVTSCFPWAVEAAKQGNPLYFLLGGAAALLPDTMDFKILRYFHRHHIEVSPDPLNPDMQMVADAIAQAIDYAGFRNLSIRLNTIRCGPDTWQKYRIQIDPGKREVRTQLEDRIDTGGNPVQVQNPLPANTGQAAFLTPIALEYLATFPVEMLDGPHLQLAPGPAGEIAVRFIPWHRSYTHSFCVSAILAGLASLLFGWTALAVVFTAHASHILLDQLGYMGSNLLWPLSRKRWPGFKLRHASSAFWNLAAVWMAIALIYSNLHGHTDQVPRIPPIGYLILAIILPLGIIHRWLGPNA